MIEFTLIVWLGVLLWGGFEIQRRLKKNSRHSREEGALKALIKRLSNEMDEYYQSVNSPAKMRNENK